MRRIAIWSMLVPAAVALNVPVQAQTYLHYRCESGTTFELTLFPDNQSAFLQVDGKSLQLPKSRLCHGRDTAERHHRLGQGERATLRRAGKHIECKVN